MKKKAIPECWNVLLWYWTSHWRWSAARQRRVLNWWQAVGWKAGWQLCLKKKGPPETTEGKWVELRTFLQRPGLAAQLDPEYFWVSLVDPAFPTALRHHAAAPTVLWSDKPWEVWSGPVLAVVGSRRSTAYGRLAVANLVPRFAQEYQALIISGGARGIDQAAHSAAIQAKQPTWVVLGCGLRQTSPSLRFAGLDHSLVRLVSAFPPQDSAASWTFPARNRVIAQLADGVMIVEAAAQSGSLITAGAALEENKDLLVVLPPFTSPNAAGAIRLLQQGATPVASVADMARGLGLRVGEKTGILPSVTQPSEKIILGYLQEQGGQARLGAVKQFFQEKWKQNFNLVSLLTTLELRGLIRIELGVVRLLGMIQS